MEISGEKESKRGYYMKKVLSLILVLVLALSLGACGKSQAAQAVDDMIIGIGTVTLESESKVVAAESAYNALNNDQKAELENYAILVAARSTLDTLLAEKAVAEQKAQAAQLDAQIEAIGTVTLESGEAIKAAWAAYRAADPQVQGYVSKLDVLESADAELKKLQAKQVSDLIAAIGKVTLDSGSKIDAAQDAYNALPADIKALVENASVLTDAATAYKDLRLAQANKMLSGMRLDNDPVRGIKFYYPKAFPYYASYGYWGADVRCFALPYLGVQGDNVWLRLVCDYTADDWIFFKKITFAVDEARYYRTFSYFDVTRDNANGDIWEYVDMEVGESEIEILWAIANSKTTIIRFEGDDYYDDFTVSANDKKAIKEMLTVYEALKAAN